MIASPAHPSQFPWIGFICLLTSLSTVIFTFIIFFNINQHVEFLNKYVKPASWLSAIVSVNSIALHIALNEGVTNAWWYKASRSDVTMQELHETYTMGTSTMAVLLAGKKFNYVAMATIFVATIPLNGFLLQNAINMVPSFEVNGTHIYVPLVPRLPLGFSADLINGTIPDQSELLQSATSSYDGISGLPAGVTEDAVGDFTLIGCISQNNSAVCKASVAIAGFDINCTLSTFEPYDLQPSSHPNGVSATVFSQNITWDPQKPDIIGLDLLYKPNQTCKGFYARRTCEFPAAMMNMTLQTNSNKGYLAGYFFDGLSADDLSTPVFSLDVMTDNRHDFNYSGPLAPYSAEGQYNSTYGGIAQWLAAKYNASIDWTYSNGSWKEQRNGVMARSYSFLQYLYQQNATTHLPDDENEPAAFNPKPDDPSWCQNVYGGLDWTTEAGGYGYPGVYPEDSIYVTLNGLMLSASIAEFNAEFYNNDSIEDELNNATANSSDKDYEDDTVRFWRKYYHPISDAQQYTDVLRYDIRWGYYAGSVAVTVSIILMILPLFYGFWWLERRQTLSPFETAAAFQAPGFEGIDKKVKVDVVLKEIGTRPVHMHPGGSDTVLSSIPQPGRSMSTPALR